MSQNTSDGTTSSAPANRPANLGDTAPDFTLPDAAGTPVCLSEQANSVLLIFYRGSW